MILCFIFHVISRFNSLFWSCGRFTCENNISVWIYLHQYHYRTTETLVVKQTGCQIENSGCAVPARFTLTVCLLWHGYETITDKIMRDISLLLPQANLIFHPVQRTTGSYSEELSRYNPSLRLGGKCTVINIFSRTKIVTPSL